MSRTNSAFQHHPEEGIIILLREAERAGEAFAHPRRKARVA